jgi:bleomycin hydrolase
VRTTRRPEIARFLAIAVALPFLLATTAGAETRRPGAATPSQIREVREKGLRTAAVKRAFVAKAKSDYAIQVPRSAIRDQDESGRCWAFAWTKTLQTMAASKGRDAGNLSPTFINYWALRTQAYAAIAHALRIAKSPERTLDDLDENTVSEGGYSHWANQLVKRHGIVPEDKMPSESFDSRKSHVLQNQLHRIVAAAHRDLWKARSNHVTTRRKIAMEYKAKVDALLKTMIGEPPRSFVVDGKTYSPLTYRRDYLKLADNDLEFVQLSNDPNRDWNRRYREAYGGGVPDNHTYNVSMGVIEQAAVKTLKQGIAVNVAANVDWDNPHRVAPREDSPSQANGILSMKAFEYGKLVPPVHMSKRDRMYYGLSMSNHMMAITGYNPKKRGEQARWQIDNSHGAHQFRDGRLDMYDDFFRHYVEEVTVPKSALPASLLKKIDARPAADAIEGMTTPKSEGGDKWTPKRRAKLVEVLIREELDVEGAAKRYNLPAATVQKWLGDARKALVKSQRK